MRVLDDLLDLLLAPVCLACNASISSADPARLVCRRCRSRLRTLPAPCCARCGAPRLATGREAGPRCAECESWPDTLRAARSACLLAPPADTIVHQLKYRGWKALAGFMAERMAAMSLPADAASEAMLCVPVPTTAARKRHRGYNQAELIARHYAERTGRTVLHALVRWHGSGSQTTLQPVARRANVAGAFRVSTGTVAALRRAHLLLVDDVLTTGATAAECTRSLTAAGARCVTLITFARALDARRLTQT